MPLQEDDVALFFPHQSDPETQIFGFNDVEHEHVVLRQRY